MKKGMFLLLLMLPSWHLCLCQIDPWEQTKLIPEGRSIYVQLASGKTVSGKMGTWNEDGLMLSQPGDHTVHVAKADVTQISVGVGKSRGQKAKWAFLIGGTAGGSLMGLTAASVDGTYAGVGGGTGGFFLFGGISAAIAALVPQHKEVIYSNPGVIQPGKR
jgi:hypothetical protein